MEYYELVKYELISPKDLKRIIEENKSLKDAFAYTSEITFTGNKLLSNYFFKVYSKEQIESPLVKALESHMAALQKANEELLEHKNFVKRIKDSFWSFLFKDTIEEYDV